MNSAFATIAASVKYVRLQRNINQETAAHESGISLRTLQNIEAGKAVNTESLLAYLEYLDLLQNMLAALPDPKQLTPMELLASQPSRRKRSRNAVTSVETGTTSMRPHKVIIHKPAAGTFRWGDEKRGDEK